jgi:hypothetical protein
VRLVRQHSPLVRAVLGIATAGAALLVSSPAEAENKLSFDAGAAFPDGGGNDDGFGLGLRYGHEWDLAIISLVPEMGLGYHAFGGPNDADVVTVVGGGRIAIGFILEPSVYAHAGVGHVWSDVTSFTSLAYDVGAALDLTAIPMVAFGPHLTLGGVAGNKSRDPFSWLEIGGHVTFGFGP